MSDTNELKSAGSAGQNPPEDELSQIRARVAELEGLITHKDQELTFKDTRISDLERSESSLRQVVADKENEIATLKQALVEADESLSKVGESLKQAVASYKMLVIQSNPDIPEELVAGDSIEAITDSLTSAKELVSKIRKSMETEISLARVPAGAPERIPPDLSALSSREKIQYAVGSLSP